MHNDISVQTTSYQTVSTQVSLCNWPLADVTTARQTLSHCSLGGVGGDNMGVTRWKWFNLCGFF